jgi:hypothetical protein
MPIRAMRTPPHYADTAFCDRRRMGVKHFQPDTLRPDVPQQGTGPVIARPKGHATQYAPLLEPVKKDMYGVTLGQRLGARRRAAGSRRGRCRQLAGATGTTRSAERRRSHAGSAGSARSAMEAGLPRSVPHPRAPRACRTAGSEHAVVAVIAAVVMPENYGAGKENDRQDENDAGDNHNPCCGHVELGRFGRRRCWRSCGDGSRLGRGFGRFTHALNIAQAHNRRNRFRQQNCCELTPGTSVPVTAMKRSPALGRAPGY